MLLVKSGKAIDSEDPQYDDNALVHEIKCETGNECITNSTLSLPLPPSLSPVINRYRKQRLHKTANLLTGEADISPGSIKVRYIIFLITIRSSVWDQAFVTVCIY